MAGEMNRVSFFLKADIGQVAAGKKIFDISPDSQYSKLTGDSYVSINCQGNASLL